MEYLFMYKKGKRKSIQIVNYIFKSNSMNKVNFAQGVGEKSMVYSCTFLTEITSDGSFQIPENFFNKRCARNVFFTGESMSLNFIKWLFETCS